MGVAVVPTKINHNTIEIRCDGRLIGVVRGEEMQTKTVTKMVRQVQQPDGKYKEEEYDHVETGTVNTLIEKAKCIVLWMTCTYNARQFGPVIHIENYD